MKLFYCDICPGSVPMKLKERLPNSQKGYRKRRFKCPVCDYEKVIYAGGEGDEKIFPERGIATVRAIAKKESENRDFERGQ